MKLFWQFDLVVFVAIAMAVRVGVFGVVDTTSTVCMAMGVAMVIVSVAMTSM